MGKYTELAKTLPRAPKVPVSEAVNAAKDTYRTRTPAALAAAYEEVKDELALHDEARKAITTRQSALEALLYTAYDEGDITSLKLKSGRTVSVNPEPYVVTINRDEVREWAQANGHERDLNFNANTLSAIVKARALAKDGLPPGVELKVWSRVGITKG